MHNFSNKLLVPPSVSSPMASSPPHVPLFLHMLCFSLLLCSSGSRPVSITTATQVQNFTLSSVRDVLVREEDSIVFCLIERARYPSNSPAYDASFFGGIDDGGRSLLEMFVRESEGVQTKAGRYQNPEEIPFFPDGLPFPLVTQYFPKFLYPAAASVNVSKTLWNMYTEKLLPLFVAKGDDGNYASTAASDLVCLQALSRRIHFGRFVAEVKFRDAPQDYKPAIRCQDRETLMNLLTNKSVEEEVKKRVKKKAKIFGRNVTLDDNNEKANSTAGMTTFKVDPSVAYRLYGKWVIPLTKLVEIEYLLHRLD